MKIGLNSYTFNNDIKILKNIKNLINTIECSKIFYKENYKELEKLNIECQTFNSLIIGNYELPRDCSSFKKELKETCLMANDFGVKKLMFGMARFRTDPGLENFFIELVEECRNFGLILMFEAIPKNYLNNKWLCNHSELIEFSKRNNIEGIHIDFGTLYKNNESFDKIQSEYNILNIHYPIGKIIDINYNVSLENYTNKKLSEIEIIKCLKMLQ